MKIQWIGFSEKSSPIELRQSLGAKGKMITWYSEIDQLEQSINDPSGIVLFLHESETYSVYELSREISLKYPVVSIVLLVSEVDYKKAMYSGAIDIVSLPVVEKEVAKAVSEAERLIEEKLSTHTNPVENKQGSVITVCSTKGGVGKTTVSVNLAVALSKLNKKVVVLDLDLQFGDVAILFDVQPKKTIYEWVKECYEQDGENVQSFITSHSSGVDVLAAPLLPEFAELISGIHVTAVIEQLKKHYDFVIIDTPPSLVETVLVSLEHSDEIFLITSMDLPTLKNGKLAIETLQLLGIKDKIKIILNRDTEMEGMKVDTVEKILATKVDAKIPSDYKTVVQSFNKGTPFVYSHPKIAVSKGIVSLADEMVNGPENNTKKRSVFRMFFRKRGKVNVTS
ncbi:hypothetical protein BKP35_01295 [Anaerobacillus arseniciselenatis]|uniref:AAA domain-containing protein n=1 Tax=Anaerobacillus arseniciselenatis TaxID=85682 RepID=A0A1S2LSZ1_9BACI|nr:AAA family ATPase [Anaerobacillus arseniciselenatis]OIJ15659.1 hypothetical protein BKP35_01295 [Anaerobacillus arseniciselenatis]